MSKISKSKENFSEETMLFLKSEQIQIDANAPSLKFENVLLFLLCKRMELGEV
jgi:hypothetical protein